MTQAMPKLSYAEYLALERESGERYEFVDGAVHAMAGGSPQHSRLAAALIAELHTALRGQPCAVFTSDLKLHIASAHRSTYADVVVVCGPDLTAEIDHHAVINPTVIVEVLSSGSEAADRGDKWRDYQRLPSLREYVLVAQDEPRIEVYRRVGDDWVVHTATAGQRMELPSHGVAIDVDAIYADPRG